MTAFSRTIHSEIMAGRLYTAYWSAQAWRKSGSGASGPVVLEWDTFKFNHGRDPQVDIEIKGWLAAAEVALEALKA